MAKKLKVRGGWWQFTKPLSDLQAFETHGSLKGFPVKYSTEFTLGRLPVRYRNHVLDFGTDYVVMSWNTPIAWHSKLNGWDMPNETYSVSTSRQQGRIRTALSEMGAL